MEQYPTVNEGRYVVTQCIGSGGMGAVFRCHDQTLKVDRALKVLRPELVSRPLTRQRFTREAVSMANLNHPNIVQVYDYGEEALTLYIVMEYLPDDSVKTYLERVGPMSAELAVHVCLQAGRGLQFMHENGAVHRDIKPGNLLISGSTIKVGDFGLVKGDYDQLQTHSDAVMGTFAFMSPEQRLGSKTVNHQTDIYALTATLYNCLTGEASLDLHEQEERKRLLQGIDPALAQIMEKGLKGSQSERYASMADMVTELETYLATCPNGSDFDLSRIKSEASLQPHDHEHVHRIWAQYTSQDGGVTEPLAVDGLESTMAPEELPLSASATRPREASAKIAPPTAGKSTIPERQHAASKATPNSTVERPSEPPSAHPSQPRRYLLYVAALAAITALVLIAIVLRPHFTEQRGAKDQVDNRPVTNEPNAKQTPSTPQPETGETVSKAQAIEAEILAGRYAQASTTLNSLPENTLSASHHITLQWLIDYLRWQPFGANWEELLLLPKLAADSTTQTPYDRWLKLLAATRERALGPDELEEQWRDLQQTNGGPIPTLMYLVSMRAPAEERYRIALKEAQASFPEANVFSHLELRANIQRGLTSAELQSLESAAVTPQSLRALVVDYALYMQRQERFAIAKRALKRTADKKAIYPESALALANLYSDSSEEHLRTQQFLMVMSDVISRRDQAAFMAYHGEHLAQRGRLSEAIKLWNFCLPAKDAEDSAHDGPEQTTVNPMQVACLEKKRFAALWFERTKQARATIEDGQRLSAKVATDAYVRRELAMTTIESQARLSLTDEKNPARFGVLRDEFNAIAARQPTSVAAIRGVYRLQQYALSVADSDRTLETLASRAQVPDAYRPCYELYDDAALSQRHAATKDGERRKQLLNSVVKGQCMQRKTYPFVRARAQLDLAEMYLNAGNRGDAQDILNTYAQAHTRADKDLIDQIRATQLKAKL